MQFLNLKEVSIKKMIEGQMAAKEALTLFKMEQALILL